MADTVSFQERIRRGLRKLEGQGWDVRTVETSEILSVSRGLIRGKDATKAKKDFDAKTKNTASAAVAVSIAKRNFREDGSGCEKFDGKGRPTDAALGRVEEDAA